ncbi:MAG: hypothetical protein D6775_06265, partial [Caldilineae bacterium]
QFLVCLSAAGLIGLLLFLPAIAQMNSRAYLPLAARNAWLQAPTPTLPVTPWPTMTPAPADIRVVSSATFTQTIGAETFLFIVGEVGNAGSTPVSDLTVSAALLDSAGELIEHVTEPVYQTMLGPGQTTPFRMMEALPANYASHTLYLDFRPATGTPPPIVTPSSRNVYVDRASGWQYYLGEFSNSSGVDMADVQAVVTLYDEFGDVINVADSGRGANSLFEDVVGVGQQRPFRVVLRYGPKDSASLRWQVTYHVADRPAPASLPIHVGHVARSSGTLRDENGNVIGVTEWFDLYGEVENTTTGPIRAVRVYATFYGSDGAVTNAGQVQSLHGRLGRLAPGERTPFHLNISSGLIPDVETPRRLGVTYAPASEIQPDQVSITTWRAYRETHMVAGAPVEWLNVVGQVRNDGVDSVQDVRVIATFYDGADRVVNTMAGQIFRPILPAGGASPFKIRTASGPLSFDHFSLDVTAHPSTVGEPSGLELDVQAPAPGSVPAVFHGEVINASGKAATGVRVFVALYDASGQILVAEEQLVADDLPAGASVPFTLRVESSNGWQTYEMGAFKTGW